MSFLHQSFIPENQPAVLSPLCLRAQSVALLDKAGWLSSAASIGMFSQNPLVVVSPLITHSSRSNCPRRFLQRARHPHREIHPAPPAPRQPIHARRPTTRPTPRHHAHDRPPCRHAAAFRVLGLEPHLEDKVYKCK